MDYLSSLSEILEKLKSGEKLAKIITAKTNIIAFRQEYFGGDTDQILNNKDRYQEAALELIDAKITHAQAVIEAINRHYLERHGDCWSKSCIVATLASQWGYCAKQVFVDSLLMYHSEVLLETSIGLISLYIGNNNVNTLPKPLERGYCVSINGVHASPSAWYNEWLFTDIIPSVLDQSFQIYGLPLLSDARFIVGDYVSGPEDVKANVQAMFPTYPTPVQLPEFAGMKIAASNTPDVVAGY